MAVGLENEKQCQIVHSYKTFEFQELDVKFL